MNTLFTILTFLVYPNARTGNVWENVVIGVIGAFIIYVISLFLSFINNRKDKKRKYWDEVKKDDTNDKK